MMQGWRQGQGGSQYRRASKFDLRITLGGARFLVELMLLAVAGFFFWMSRTDNPWWAAVGAFLVLYDLAGIVMLRKDGYEQWPVDPICDWWSRG